MSIFEEEDFAYEQWLAVEGKPEVRLDVCLTEKTGTSRSFIRNMIEEGRVLVNGETKKANYRIRAEDKIGINLPKPRELKVVPQQIPLEIIYEDDDLLVVNKPQGMVVHPAPGVWEGTLVNALLYHCRDLSGINGIIRPGIVHRIDKDTSGLLVVAKNDESHNQLAGQLKEHKMQRKYLAVVHGVLSEPSGTIDAPIGRDPKDRKKMAVVFKHSRPAVTHYEVEERFIGYTKIKAVLETGRTHQIRVHMAYIRNPVLGDPLYGPKKNILGLTGQVLHAHTLAFLHPRGGKLMEFSADPPREFLEAVDKLRELT
ncbi:ribosomal large subunit pseudouridine synthase D [Syntrophobotulus glycolicus DSM 8271]|uniref:Pseudouridine synthase n=1 Tax=Syntrophobotulus glycolicus (strain DSM 8271 / FlGlyR) TaxID=645991 RepID=F0T024_SYNGF|nr:RluA family pseudouridine synthase [Syntrophobotulus glycolicus]ADY55035.1 ribosomal large subunit pseudouridine synthase D [Syntrophobotulus glycolicus DSM 8271]